MGLPRKRFDGQLRNCNEKKRSWKRLKKLRRQRQEELLRKTACSRGDIAKPPGKNLDGRNARK